MITICLTYFKSLKLANLRAALYSVRQQDLSRVAEIIVFDNDTSDTEEEIYAAVLEQAFPVPVRLISVKHGHLDKTHSWSTNAVVRASITPWVLFTRADYILDFDLVAHLAVVTDPPQREVFITGRVVHLQHDIAECDAVDWRAEGPSLLLNKFPHRIENYMMIDAGVWMTTRSAFDRVGGLAESLTAWGHAQTHFQWKLHKAGVEAICTPYVLFYHPLHAAPRDMTLANQQAQELGLNLKDMWARYEGTSPY